MDILIGIKTKDEVLLVTSKAVARGISVLKADDNKVEILNDTTAMAYSGEPGDASKFAEYIKANIQLYNFRNGFDLSTHGIASFARIELAKSLRSRKPFQVNILIGGYDSNLGAPELRWIDYLGTNVPLPYAAHGYASYYILSLLDRHWKKDIDLEAGLELARRCVQELKTRMPIDFKGVRVHRIGASGIQEIDLDVRSETDSSNVDRIAPLNEIAT